MNETDLPAVSCMCLTYGRPQVLEEAVESFLRQDYAGVKELVILNDLCDQELTCARPEVKIVNSPLRFRSVGEKRNACAALTAHDVLLVWDDDDIFLPHRISYSVARLFESGKAFYKPSRAWILNGTTVIGPEANLFHSGACFTRDLFNAAHGYPHVGSGQDHDFEVAASQLIPGEKNDDHIPPEEIYYVYRWEGTGSYHLSRFGRDTEGQPSGNVQVEAFVREELRTGRIVLGEVEVRPHWKFDYPSIVDERLKSANLHRSGRPT